MMERPMNVEQVIVHCEQIRRTHPGEPLGRHWECFGVPLGDDLWGDPVFMGMTGGLEFLAMASEKRATRASRD